MQCIIYFIPYIYICRMKIVEKRVLFEKKRGKKGKPKRNNEGFFT